jgi:hypothetical protein
LEAIEMSRRLGTLIILSISLVFLFAGCSEDATAPPGGLSGNTGLVQGNIDPGAGTFEFRVEVLCRDGDPSAGYHVIRGTNIHYDDEVTNLSRCSHPEPISLTFVSLLPQGVTVLNPDNGEHGPGAAILFEFENDDNMWTPFEESFPRTVQFGVEPGQGVGFTARINVGPDDRGGTIGGVVFHDHNQNGVMDPGEPGLAGHGISMVTTDGRELIWVTRTAEDGSYKFEHLDASHYIVTKQPIPDCSPTTPLEIQVILVEVGGEVSDFMDAHFGCAAMVPPIMIEVGDGVEVSGYYNPQTSALVAKSIHVYKCWDEPINPPCVMPLSELMGSVMDINMDMRALQVLNRWVQFDTIPDDSVTVRDGGPCCPPIDLEDVEIGDRVRARVLPAETFTQYMIGLGLWEWPGLEDRVHGMVGHVIWMPPGNRPSSIIVLGVNVMITEGTRITFSY